MVVLVITEELKPFERSIYHETDAVSSCHHARAKQRQHHLLVPLQHLFTKDLQLLHVLACQGRLWLFMFMAVHVQFIQ